MDSQAVLSFTENPVFRLYGTYATVVTLKMICMSFITGYKRMTKKVFANPEDAQGKKQYVREDDSVERVRRCHRNDLENIPPFLIVGLIYVLSGPTLFAATWHFRVFVASRFLHTVAYLTSLPQPSRGGCFAIGVFTVISMAVQILRKYAQF